MDSTTLDYVSNLTCLLLNTRIYEFDEWRDCCVPYLGSFLTEEGAEGVCRAFMAKCLAKLGDEEQEDQGWIDDDEGEVDELCNCRCVLLGQGTQGILQRLCCPGSGKRGYGKSSMVCA